MSGPHVGHRLASLSGRLELTLARYARIARIEAPLAAAGVETLASTVPTKPDDAAVDQMG